MVFLRRSKLDTDQLHLSLPDLIRGSIGKRMNPYLPCLRIILNLVQQPRNILVISRLRLSQPRILSHTFQGLLSPDLLSDGSDTGDLSLIRLSSCKCQHIPRIQCRVSDGIRIKRHIPNHRQICQDIPTQHLPGLL